MGRTRRKMSSSRKILLGFLGLILLGALVLMLPISSKTREVTPFLDSLFTSTSAVCVTGLVVRDTAAHWSVFGQIFLLLLIQIGGLGVITVTAAVALLSGRKLALSRRAAMRETLSAENVGDIERLFGFVLKGVLIIELAGALLLLPAFCSDFGIRGVWLAVFHSISAFCNAGFDLMGGAGNEFASLTAYAAHPYVNIIVMLLIFIGGIGFLVWDDVCKHKFRLSKYRTQSKVALLVSAILIFAPALYFFFFEFSGESGARRVFLSLFQAVTPRTAGFNTANIASMSDAGRRLTMVLMLIGGSPASTAGGMKTTTLAVLFASVFSVFRKEDDISIFRRRLEPGVIKNAAALLVLYLMLFFSCGFTISLVEGLPVGDCLFEAASAIGTVGLSTGITPLLGPLSKSLLMVLMFFGRVGGLTLIYATVGKEINKYSKYPIDQITVG